MKGWTISVIPLSFFLPSFFCFSNKCNCQSVLTVSLRYFDRKIIYKAVYILLVEDELILNLASNSYSVLCVITVQDFGHLCMLLVFE